jgi:hypothetical protein
LSIQVGFFIFPQPIIHKQCGGKGDIFFSNKAKETYKNSYSRNLRPASLPNTEEPPTHTVSSLLKDSPTPFEIFFI